MFLSVLTFRARIVTISGPAAQPQGASPAGSIKPKLDQVVREAVASSRQDDLPLGAHIAPTWMALNEAAEPMSETPGRRVSSGSRGEVPTGKRELGRGSTRAFHLRRRSGGQLFAAYLSAVHAAAYPVTELNRVNSFHYRTELLRHAEELNQNPSEWMPWNYRETLARLVMSAAA